tara:strand:+ start:485 stop:1411 length:927 start_codon:yes stop_codon:yes gene_type:complete
MAVSATVTPGTILTEGEAVTISKLNALGTPTVDISGAVGSLSLSDGSVTNAKIATGAAIQYDKLATLNTGQVLVGNAGTPTAATLSGDATIDASGALTLGSGVVEAGMLATDSVGASAISANAVGASELADDAVDTAAIVDGAVTSAKLASEARGKVLQVVFASTDATTFTHNQDTFTDITGVSASITPSSTSSRILIEVSITHSGSTNLTSAFGIDRDSTAIGNSDEGTGLRINAIATDFSDGDTHTQTTSYRYMDTTHNSTSALTYKATVAARTNYTFQLNKAYNDQNHQHNMLGISSITLTEISA